MGELISLKLKRKELARSEKAKTAEANRQKFGQTKSEKQHIKQESARAQKALDTHKRET